jgi:hypothetical protein
MDQADVPSCTFEDCDKPVKARQLCDSHYRRFRLYGHPSGGGTKPGPKATPWWVGKR